MHQFDSVSPDVDGQESFGYGIVCVSGELPYAISSTNRLMETLLRGKLRRGTSLLEYIPSDEVGPTVDALERTMVQDLPVRMENHFVLDDGSIVTMNGWCHTMVGRGDFEEICCTLIPEESDETHLRESVRRAYAQALSVAYDSIYEISGGYKFIRCVKASSLLPKSPGGGVRGPSMPWKTALGCACPSPT